METEKFKTKLYCELMLKPTYFFFILLMSELIWFIV